MKRALLIAVAGLIVMLAAAIIFEVAPSIGQSLPAPVGAIAPQPMGNGLYRVFPRSGRASVGVSYQIRLFTHCGLDWPGVLDFDGSFWDPIGPGPASDGNANPPVGYGNPYDPGTITLISPALARYRSSSGGVMQWNRHAGGAVSAPCS